MTFKKCLIFTLLVAGLSTQFTHTNRALRSTKLVQAATRAARQQRQSKLPVKTPLETAEIKPETQRQEVQHTYASNTSFGQAFKEGVAWSAAWHATGAIIRSIFESFRGE